MAVFCLAIYIAVIFIRPMEWEGALVYGWPLVNAAAILTLFAGFTAFPKVLDEHIRFTQIPEVVIGALLLFSVALSWLYPFWGTGIIESFQEFGKTVLLFSAVVLLGRNSRNFRIVLWTVLICVTWMALHGILQIQNGVGFGKLEPRWRSMPTEDDPYRGVYQIVAFGVFNDPNDLCLVFIIAIPLLWAHFRATPNVVVKGFTLVLISLSAYAAWLTNSRGGIVGIFGMLAGYAIARTKGFRRWALVVISIGVVTVVMPARGGQLGMVDLGRVNAWGDGIAAFKRFPVYGVGYGNFGEISSNVAAHNSYINALTELGLFGYIPFFLLLYLTITHLRRVIDLKGFVDHRDQAYLAGLYSALCGYLTAIYFLSRTYNPVLYVLLGLTICAVIIACHQHNLYAQVFGNFKRDLQRGLFWCFASIPFLWVTIRIANRMAGR